MIKDVETNSQKYSENPTWNGHIQEHRKRQFATERGFKFVDYYFQRNRDLTDRYSLFDKELFEALKGRIQVRHAYGLLNLHVLNVSDYIDKGGEFGYPDVARLVAEAADRMNIRNKTVLVIGTEMPWMETVLLQRKPRSRTKIMCQDSNSYLFLQERSHCRIYENEKVKRTKALKRN